MHIKSKQLQQSIKIAKRFCQNNRLPVASTVLLKPFPGGVYVESTDLYDAHFQETIPLFNKDMLSGVSVYPDTLYDYLGTFEKDDNVELLVDASTSNIKVSFEGDREKHVATFKGIHGDEFPEFGYFYEKFKTKFVIHDADFAKKIRFLYGKKASEKEMRRNTIASLLNISNTGIAYTDGFVVYQQGLETDTVEDCSFSIPIGLANKILYVFDDSEPIVVSENKEFESHDRFSSKIEFKYCLSSGNKKVLLNVYRDDYPNLNQVLQETNNYVVVNQKKFLKGLHMYKKYDRVSLYVDSGELVMSANKEGQQFVTRVKIVDIHGDFEPITFDTSTLLKSFKGFSKTAIKLTLKSFCSDDNIMFKINDDITMLGIKNE